MKFLSGINSSKSQTLRAFTLIELLIVVAIIAILAAIAVPNFLEAQVRAKVSRARTDMRSVATALETYAVDNNKYPPILGNANATPSQPLNLNNGYGSLRSGPWRGVPQNLTTPIAYLTSIIPDVFKQSQPCAVDAVYASTPDVGKPYSNGNPFDSSFIYQNIQQLVVAYGPNGTVYNDADLAAYGAWRLMSVGPDHKYNAIGSDNPVDKLGWFYDPTNGTVTAGMIVRTQRDPQNTNSTRTN